MGTGFEILNPTAKVTGGDAGSGSSIKRIESPKGLRIGLLDNGMPHAGDFLGHLGASFEKRHQAVLLTRRKGYTARSAEIELLDEIASQCDVAVTGFGV
jgi:hypothetical protein